MCFSVSVGYLQGKKVDTVKYYKKITYSNGDGKLTGVENAQTAKL
jgi:hypothetical protein